MLKGDLVLVFLIESCQTARMLMQGLIMSGLRIPRLAILGPLFEKEAIDGARSSPIIFPLNEIEAVEVIYAFTLSPSA